MPDDRDWILILECSLKDDKKMKSREPYPQKMNDNIFSFPQIRIYCSGHLGECHVFRNAFKEDSGMREQL